ncbi:uncharacterized protein BJ171DRAFT_640845 [Polychytrium aggregatum]|uniref:uncharacterized protein n=1 Tax=Polychytrium aggregatum TaxID=110093 RepID=UPI0022FF27F0|nr:uncharacterized protein BJ171DRAFT_640845 [Polychytrium aggregatum]KAI9193188.1 hypothetical protein BJ171DRAFT_640845 [Polychytrium aggregatum]
MTMQKGEPKAPLVPGGGPRHLKLFMHPPSIPTKFQTFHFDDREPKGFNSTAPRFDLNPNELPGPGYYQKPSRIALIDEASISKKGFGVGFASKLRRFRKPPTELEFLPVAPGQYNVSGHSRYSHSLSSSKTSSFAKPVAAPAPKRRALPGPGQYDAAPPTKSGHVAESGAVFVFKSKTRRSEINCPEATPGWDAPPPGAYEVRDITHRSGAVAAFKSTIRKQQSSQKTNAPGPGSYELINKPLRNLAKRRSEFTSVVQAPPRPYSGHKGIVPGPGFYELASASDAVQHKGPVANHVFASASPRFPVNPNGSKPGPGFYQPVPELKFRSFHLNIDGIWT